MTNHCHQFVDELLRAADAAMRSDDVQDRASFLAAKLVDAFVPATVVAGVDVRKVLGGGRGAAGSAAPEYPDEVRGFRPELVAGGQDGEALRHFAAAAAAVLNGRSLLVSAAIIVDAAQVLGGRSVKEARAEIADDRAGAAAGKLLARYLRQDLERDELGRRLRALLCR